MIAALATLPFLAAIWLVAVLGAAMLEESGAKIAAALKGRATQPPIACSSTRTRVRMRAAQPVRFRMPMRAAA
jgi:hypothetical protein